MKNFPKMLTQSVKNMVYDKVDCEMVCLMVFHEIHEILRSKLLAHILRLPSRNSSLLLPCICGKGELQTPKRLIKQSESSEHSS